MKTLTALFLGASVLLPLCGAEWNLKPTNGNVQQKWDTKKPNWTWEQKNPFHDNGIVWTLFSQNQLNPPKEGPFQPMKQAVAWGYTWLWEGEKNGKETISSYSEFKLLAPARKNEDRDGAGKTVGIQFKPDQPGKYEISISGKIKVSQPTAGHARVELYTLDSADQTVSLLKQLNLNGSKGYGNYPSDFKWKGQVVFDKNTVFVLRLQSINPGPASCGASVLDFNEFKITKPNLP